jgi:hypothetical protein
MVKSFLIWVSKPTGLIWWFGPQNHHDGFLVWVSKSSALRFVGCVTKSTERDWHRIRVEVGTVYYLQDLVFQLLLFVRESTFSPGFNLVLVFLRRCGLDSVPALKISVLLAWVWLRFDFCPAPVLFWSGPLFDSLFLLGLRCRSRFFSCSIIFGPASWSAGWDLSFFVRPSVASRGPDFNLCRVPSWRSEFS